MLIRELAYGLSRSFSTHSQVPAHRTSGLACRTRMMSSGSAGLSLVDNSWRISSKFVMPNVEVCLAATRMAPVTSFSRSSTTQPSSISRVVPVTCFQVQADQINDHEEAVGGHLRAA